MIILTGKTGSGKSTVIRALSLAGFNRVVTCTTRPHGAGEADGRDYHFFDEGTFQKMKKDGMFAETSHTGRYSYGSLKESYEDPNGVVILDPDGVRSVVEAVGKEQTTVFFLDAPDALLRDRIIKRGDDPHNALKRLHEDNLRYEGFALFDYRIQQNEKSSAGDIAELISQIAKRGGQKWNL